LRIVLSKWSAKCDPTNVSKIGFLTLNTEPMLILGRQNNQHLALNAVVLGETLKPDIPEHNSIKDFCIARNTLVVLSTSAFAFNATSSRKGFLPSTVWKASLGEQAFAAFTTIDNLVDNFDCIAATQDGNFLLLGIDHEVRIFKLSSDFVATHHKVLNQARDVFQFGSIREIVVGPNYSLCLKTHSKDEVRFAFVYNMWEASNLDVSTHDDVNKLVSQVDIKEASVSFLPSGIQLASTSLSSVSTSFVWMFNDLPNVTQERKVFYVCDQQIEFSNGQVSCTQCLEEDNTNLLDSFDQNGQDPPIQWALASLVHQRNRTKLAAQNTPQQAQPPRRPHKGNDDEDDEDDNMHLLGGAVPHDEGTVPQLGGKRLVYAPWLSHVDIKRARIEDEENMNLTSMRMKRRAEHNMQERAKRSRT
jgi:hypothetical protein